MKRLFVLCLLFPLTASAAWVDWWQRKDQQAEKLLAQGKAAQAAQLFERKDWQSTANYRAGDYQAAAKEFKQLQQWYNQGNALAHLGQYDQAIKAYEQALKENPNHEDAKFNKELLEKLKQQAENQQQPQNQQQQNDKQDQQDNKDKKDKKDQQNNNDQKDKSDQENSQNNNDQKDKSDQKDKDDRQHSPNKKDQEDMKDQKNSQDNKNQRDKKDLQDKQAKPGEEKLQQANQQPAKADPNKERRQQWLDKVPDDPGGLLKQKFHRDHLKQQGWEKYR